MNFAGKARGKCVTGVGHKVQLPLGPSTRLCLETIRYERRHNVQPPLGPSTGRLNGKLGVVEVSILCPEGALALPSREGGSRSETGELKT